MHMDGPHGPRGGRLGCASAVRLGNFLFPRRRLRPWLRHRPPWPARSALQMTRRSRRGAGVRWAEPRRRPGSGRGGPWIESIPQGDRRHRPGPGQGRSIKGIGERNDRRDREPAPQRTSPSPRKRRSPAPVKPAARSKRHWAIQSIFARRAIEQLNGPAVRPPKGGRAASSRIRKAQEAPQSAEPGARGSMILIGSSRGATTRGSICGLARLSRARLNRHHGGSFKRPLREGA